MCPLSQPKTSVLYLTEWYTSIMETLFAPLLITITTRGKVGWKLRVSILTDAARALEFLHRKGLIHRDIKSPNILLDSQHRCKIADFGMARQIGTDMTVVGTGEFIGM